MLASCEYLPQEMLECTSETCEVYPIDEDLVPTSVKGRDEEEWQFDLDGWARWDMPTDDYYDLSQYPEGYTAYDGSSIWEFIHGKVAFPERTAVEGSWRMDFNRAVSGMHACVSASILMSLPTEEGGGAGEREGDDGRPVFTREEVRSLLTERDARDLEIALRGNRSWISSWMSVLSGSSLRL